MNDDRYIQRIRQNCCCICTRDTVNAILVCDVCAKEYNLIGRKLIEWPDWVKAMRNFEQQDILKIEFDFVELSYGTFEDLEEIIDERLSR